MENDFNFMDGFMVRADNGDWFVKPICDFFGIEYENQIQNISRDKICQSDTGKNRSQAVFGDLKLRLTLQSRGFARWIQIINPSIVRSQIRDKFEIFQANIFSYLWEGNIEKTNQLEDIRSYALNINSALQIKDQVMAYIAEQKNHRDLCLASEPAQWAIIKPTLAQEKQLPEGSIKLKAIGSALSNDKDDLMRLKKNYQTAMVKDRNLLLYSSKYKQPEENPMPDGFRKETIKLRMKTCEEKIEEINQRLFDLQQ